MNNDSLFDLLIAVVFSMSPQLWGLGPKDQDIVIYFCLGEGEYLPQLNLKALQIRGEIILLQYETWKINNLTGKYIVELSKLKHIKWYMTSFELDYRKFERLTQRHQISTTFTSPLNKYFKPQKQKI